VTKLKILDRIWGNSYSSSLGGL